MASLIIGRLVRVVVVSAVYSMAKTRRRGATEWALFTLFFPLVVLVVMSFMSDAGPRCASCGAPLEHQGGDCDCSEGEVVEAEWSIVDDDTCSACGTPLSLRPPAHEPHVLVCPLCFYPSGARQ